MSIRATSERPQPMSQPLKSIALHVVKLSEAKYGFVLLPRRGVVERSFAWATRCRRLVKDYERYASTLAGFHVAAFCCATARMAGARHEQMAGQVGDRAVVVRP